MKYTSQLIPPTIYASVSDENWYKIFGKVNREGDSPEDYKGKTGRTYEERVKDFLEKQSKKKTAD